MIEKKISARRYGRLLAVLYLNDKMDIISNGTVPPIYIEDYVAKLETYLPEYPTLPSNVQYQIVQFAQTTIIKIYEQENLLINIISKTSTNRTWDKFLTLDKALLLIGVLNLQTETTPSVIIKEILIVSDLLNNHNAAPYLSGILKSIAFPIKERETSSIFTNFKKTSKIRLKTSQ